MAMTSSLWNDSDPAGHSTGGFSRDATWFSCALSTLDDALNNKSNVPANATITGLRLYVSARQESAGANVYLKYGFGGTESISAYLYGSSSGNGNSVGSSSSDHPSGGVDIKGYLNRTVQSDSTPFKLSRSYGEYLAFRFISSNIFGKTYYINSVKLDITYQEHSEHSYISTVTVQPTCTEPGTTLFDCSVCARGYYDYKIPAALGHSFGSTIAAKAATCTEQGNTAYKKCSRCGLHFAGDAATNSTDGKSDTSSFLIAKNPNNHSGNQVTLSAVAPTCTATGLTEGKYWSCCNTIITAQQTVAALGHSWGTTTYTWSEDGKTCIATRECSRCGTTETATATITSEVSEAADCTTWGKTKYTATFGVDWATTQTKNVLDIPSTGHTPGETVIENRVEATCTATGSYYEVVYCTVCGKQLRRTQKTIPAKGHSYTTQTFEPTETSAGYTRYTCSVCGYSYDTDYTYRLKIIVENGTVSGVVDGGIYAKGSKVNFTAIPDEGYEYRSAVVYYPDGSIRSFPKNTGILEFIDNITFVVKFKSILPEITSVTITRSSDLAKVTIDTPVEAGAKFIISVEVT